MVFDEGSYLDGPVPTPVILDNLIAASRIPATVAVLIANPSQESRNKELPPNPDFADFLGKELVPWIHGRYNVTSDPRLTVVGGSSYGGTAATFAGLRHPEVFGNVLCQSGSFWWAPDHTFGSGTSTETGWLAKEFVKSPKLALLSGTRFSNRPTFVQQRSESELRGVHIERQARANGEAVSNAIQEARMHGYSGLARRVLYERNEFQIECQAPRAFDRDSHRESDSKVICEVGSLAARVRHQRKHKTNMPSQRVFRFAVPRGAQHEDREKQDH